MFDPDPFKAIFQLPIAAAVICLSCAAPQNPDVATGGAPELVREYNNVNEDGTYSFGFEYSDGTFKTESKDAEGNVKGLSLSQFYCFLCSHSNVKHG